MIRKNRRAVICTRLQNQRGNKHNCQNDSYASLKKPGADEEAAPILYRQLEIPSQKSRNATLEIPSRNATLLPDRKARLLKTSGNCTDLPGRGLFRAADRCSTNKKRILRPVRNRTRDKPFTLTTQLDTAQAATCILSQTAASWTQKRSKNLWIVKKHVTILKSM